MRRQTPKRQPAPDPPTKLSHPSYSIEPCPNCEYPEADGGYCPECGWSRYRPDCPHCEGDRR